MSAFLEEAMKISWQFLLAGIMCLVSLTAAAQDAEAKRDVKVNWVRGTDFSKYRTYAWGTSHQKTPNPFWNQHLIEDIDAALQAKGLHKVEMGASSVFGSTTGIRGSARSSGCPELRLDTTPALPLSSAAVEL
jgi:hypothetical protein